MVFVQVLVAAYNHSVVMKIMYETAHEHTERCVLVSRDFSFRVVLLRYTYHQCCVCDAQPGSPHRCRATAPDSSRVLKILLTEKGHNNKHSKSLQ